MAESSGGCAVLTGKKISELKLKDIHNILCDVNNIARDISIFSRTCNMGNFGMKASIFG